MTGSGAVRSGQGRGQERSVRRLGAVSDGVREEVRSGQ